MKKMFDKIKYNNNYNKETYKAVSFRLNQKTEADLIEWLADRDTKSYFVELIRRDMRTVKRRQMREERKKNNETV